MQKTANPYATAAAQRLLNYISDTAGKAVITGQHTQTNSMEEIGYIRSLTSREPLLRGFELLAYSPNINYNDASEECLTEVRENRGTVETALQWAKSGGGITTLTFHWFSPLGGRDKSFYAKNTDFDAEKILTEGTPERAAFYRDMDAIAKQLKKFAKADIPVLWRPFHEADGKWFWWGAKGAETASKLYRLMYDYYTNILHLDNILWVWSCAEAYPGDDCVDIVSMDIYLDHFEKTDYREQYERLIKATSPNKTAALAEIGYLPDIEMLSQSHTPWAYFMTWSKEFIIGEQYNMSSRLKMIYEHPYAVSKK